MLLTTVTAWVMIPHSIEIGSIVRNSGVGSKRDLEAGGISERWKT
jgi:hypothetical protein